VSAQVFWPPAEAAQADYEMLRSCVLAGGCLAGGPAAARFARRGLAGLIAWPAAEPDFRAEVCGAARPRWTPHAGPRTAALAAACQFMPDAAGALAAPGPQLMRGWP
jgi:hypothetical protein